jgi:hypothetical protein
MKTFLKHFLKASPLSTIQIKRDKGQFTMETLNFDNKVLRALPIDEITENYCRQVKNACFSKVINISNKFPLYFK